MKKQLLTIALLAGALTASAGVNLVVSGKQQQSFAVGDIGKTTFSESTMDVYGKDSGKIGTFSLSDITKLFFSDKEGNVTEINPDGALKFAKTGNTLNVDGLSAATDAFIVSASGRHRHATETMGRQQPRHLVADRRRLYPCRRQCSIQIHQTVTQKHQ